MKIAAGVGLLKLGHQVGLLDVLDEVILSNLCRKKVKMEIILWSMTHRFMRNVVMFLDHHSIFWYFLSPPLFQQSPRLHCQRLLSLPQYLPLSSRSHICLSKEKQYDVQEVYDQYQISLDCNYGLIFLIWFIFMANTFGSTNSLSSTH